MLIKRLFWGGTPTLIAEAETLGNLTYEKIDEDWDGTYDYVEITDCDESAVSVDIPAEIEGLPVTSIGWNAFYGCASLSSVTIPDSVISIESRAFENCTSLENVNIPDSVTSIGSNAFYNTAILNNQTGVKYVDTWVVDYDDYDDYAITAEIKDGTTAIATYAFCNCTSLTSVTIPDSVTSIGDYAFCYCTNLKSITIPDSVTSIGDYAFENCTSLENVNIPDSVTSVGAHAFLDTPLVNNQSGVKYVDTWIVECDKDVTTAEIKNGTTGIAAAAFSSCDSLTNITIPKSVASIGDRAFGGIDYLMVTIENPDCVIEGDIGYGVILVGEEGSAVEEYAKANDYVFNPVILGDERVCEVELEYDSERAVIVSVDPTKEYYVLAQEENGKVFWLRTEDISSLGYGSEYCDFTPDSSNSIIELSAFKDEILEHESFSYNWVEGETSTIKLTIVEKYTEETNFEDGMTITVPAYTRMVYNMNFDEACDITIESDSECFEHNSYQVQVTGSHHWSMYDGEWYGLDAGTNVLRFGPFEEDVEISINKVTEEDPTEPTEPEIVTGDLSGNATIDLYDAIEVAKAVMGMRTLTAEEESIADFNGDGVVDLYDVIAIAVEIMK